MIKIFIEDNFTNREDKEKDENVKKVSLILLGIGINGRN